MLVGSSLLSFFFFTKQTSTSGPSLLPLRIDHVFWMLTHESVVKKQTLSDDDDVEEQDWNLVRSDSSFPSSPASILSLRVTFQGRGRTVPVLSKNFFFYIYIYIVLVQIEEKQTRSMR